MLLVELENIAYPECLELQRSLARKRIAGRCPDILLLVAHPPTVTLGVRGRTSDLLVPEETLRSLGVALYRSDRGGEATYHGPGQLVCYPVVDLRGLGLSARAYVHALEETILKTLGEFGIDGFRQKGKPGVWIAELEKIASIGVRIDRRVAYHGFSLNVSLEHDPSRFVISCGMPQTRHVSMNALATVPVAMETVKPPLLQCFREVFGVTLEPCSADGALGDRG
ncbi:MAG: lipoyl(octanoyl) transferase LipB [Desulfomonile tiedjei]|nr:lipoyl(octanoyl) transferase LipB [Desulfomonile tiedjei]